MARKRFHNLKRPKIRQDWSKWTLYNLSRLQPSLNTQRFQTFFQQKWAAKSIARGYHGNQIREGKWSRMFDRRLPAVVPMDPRQLAAGDGSEAGAGRGSGLKKGRDELLADFEGTERTPYMAMAFWPVERRLDTAVWRALFASSALQARQFVVHGAVRVNGRKMRHPGYLLNPGDMFQVEPDRVLYATGARKFARDNPGTRQGQRGPIGEEESPGASRGQGEDEEVEQDEDGSEVELEDGDEDAGEELQAEPEEQQDPKKALKELMRNAKGILADPKEKGKMSAKQKQGLREFKRQVQRTMGRIRGDTVKTSEGEQSAQDTVEELQQAMEKLLGKETAPSSNEASAKEDISPREDAKTLRSALDVASDVEGDEKEETSAGATYELKPYAQPWQPREYMSAFAFIPRYLEVNHRVCSAVYLRHPVARPGLAEVPGPFGEETYELAHNWYLRRR